MGKIVFGEFLESLSGFLEVEFNSAELDFLQKEQNRKIEKKEDMVILSRSKILEEHFTKSKSKKDRNSIIHLAYLDGYSQIEIANYLGLSKSLISKIINSGVSTAGGVS